MGMTVAEKIRLLAKRQGVTIGELAGKTGQTRQNLSNKLNRENFSEHDIQALAAALDCKVDILFTTASGEQI